MTNPVLGGEELPTGGPAQPETYVNDIDRRISYALAGVIDIAMPDSDYTLLADSGTPENDEWFYSIIRLNEGSPILTAERSLFYPDIDTEYSITSRMRHIIENNTSQYVTARRAGSPLLTGVRIAPGQKKAVFHNGTDLVPYETQPIVLQLAASPVGQQIVAADQVAFTRAAQAMEAYEVRAAVLVPSGGSPGEVEVDINIDGVSMLSSPLVIDAGQRSSVGSASPAVISTNTIPDDAEISIDIVRAPAESSPVTSPSVGAQQLIVTILALPG